jgi:hypothetical protein
VKVSKIAKNQFLSCFTSNQPEKKKIFYRDDHKLRPWAKLFRVRLCDWFTQVLSVVYNFRLQHLKKEQPSLRLLHSLSPKMSLINVPHSVSVNLKSIQSFGLPASNLAQPHKTWSQSPMNRRTWYFPRYRSVLDDSQGMNDLPSSCLSWRWWLGRYGVASERERTASIQELSLNIDTEFFSTSTCA